MNLQQLDAIFREEAFDYRDDPLWTPQVVASHLSEAEEEAALRMRLLLDVAEIETDPASQMYVLGGRFFEIIHAAWAPAGTTRFGPLYQTSIEALDARHPGWRTERVSRPQYLVHSDTGIRLAGAVSGPGVLQIEGYRLPKRPLRTPTDQPEINDAHHRQLVNWALYRAFLKVDTETIDNTRAANAYAAFERYFGLRPDAELNKWTRRDLAHHNTAVMP